MMHRAMNPDRITCPKCGAEIEISAALASSIEQRLRREVAAEAQQEARKLSAEAERRAREAAALELRDLKEQLAEQRKKAEASQAQELALRKQARELEEARRTEELERTRKLDEERVRIRDDARKAFEEENRLKALQQQQKIDDLTRALDEAQRKAQQGSMERQGELLEADLEQTLRQAFPLDDIEPVPKGVRGADLLQRVKDSLGRPCGLLVWETKNTKAWSEGWIQKLKDDQREVRAHMAILVSQAMPDGLDPFGFRDGVWVTRWTCMLPLATALRRHLAEVNYTQMASVGKNEKMERLYAYLVGPEFSQSITGIVETFAAMQAQLQRERRAMEKLWKEREQQIDRVLTTTSGMYGGLRGLVGSTMPEIDALDLLPPHESPRLPEPGAAPPQE